MTRSEPLYPLVGSLMIAGAVAGLAMAALVSSVTIGVAVLVLFTVCGLTWRSDMPPIYPFCFSFIWIGTCLGTMFYLVFGYYPGGGVTGGLDQMVWTSLLGFIGLAVGVRLSLGMFAAPLRRTLAVRRPSYDLTRLALLTIGGFGISFVFEVAPKAIWFGGAQIITNLIELRFVPFFVLIVLVFQRGRGYGLLAATTLVVLMPQFLTGFSRFKEVLFVILLGALFQWRPWVNAAEQHRRNTYIMAGSIVGAIFLVLFGLVWTGGVKQQWRAELWNASALENSSPIEKMGRFLEVVADTTANLDVEIAANNLAARLSSGSLFFSYVIQRVPTVVPHEGGILIGMAITNATVPRFLFPDKHDLGGDSWLVARYAGLIVAGNEQGASIGLGFLPEFYIDFGYIGVFFLSIFYTFMLGVCLLVFSLVAPNGPVFTALAINILMAYFIGFDASFIKMFAGMIQRTVILALAMHFLLPTAERWLLRHPHRRTYRPAFGRPVAAHIRQTGSRRNHERRP